MRTKADGPTTHDLPSYEVVARFHGHSCPGLASGYRMACAALSALREIRSPDEELVAIVENDACGVDAVQYVTGCTFGKGNLIFRDYGKPVYTLLSRRTGEGVRVLYHGRGTPEGIRNDRKGYIRFILSAPDEEIMSVEGVKAALPPRARIRSSVTCAFCGEPVMETRVRTVEGKPACIPCAEARSRAERNGG